MSAIAVGDASPRPTGRVVITPKPVQCSLCKRCIDLWRGVQQIIDTLAAIEGTR